MTPPPHHTDSHLARRPQAGRVNVIALLADLQDRHDETATRATELRQHIAHLTAARTETEARHKDLATTRKVIAELVPVASKPEPPETNTAYQAILNAFNSWSVEPYGPAYVFPPTVREVSAPSHP